MQEPSTYHQAILGDYEFIKKWAFKNVGFVETDAQEAHLLWILFPSFHDYYYRKSLDHYDEVIDAILDFLIYAQKNAVNCLAYLAGCNGIDSTMIYHCGARCREMVASTEREKFFSNTSNRHWPECITPIRHSLPEYDRRQIEDGHAAVCALMVKIDQKGWTCTSANIRAASAAAKKRIGYDPNASKENEEKLATYMVDVNQRIRDAHATYLANLKDAGFGELSEDMDLLGAVIEADPGAMTLGDFERAALAWKERIRLDEKFRKEAAAGKEGIGKLENHQTDEFQALREFASSRCKGKEQRFIELICDHGGACPLAIMVKDKRMQWEDDLGLNSRYSKTLKRINDKLECAKLPWEIVTHDKSATASRISHIT